MGNKNICHSIYPPLLLFLLISCLTPPSLKSLKHVIKGLEFFLNQSSGLFTKMLKLALTLKSTRSANLNQDHSPTCCFILNYPLFISPKIHFVVSKAQGIHFHFSNAYATKCLPKSPDVSYLFVYSFDNCMKNLISHPFSGHLLGSKEQCESIRISLFLRVR